MRKYVHLSNCLQQVKFPLILSLLTILTIIVIELNHPYFFLQDDNRDQFLPLMVHNFRAVTHGEIPLFNFHQLLGTPVLSCMQSAALYPVGYFAVYFSKLFFGHYYASIEIMAAIHLVIAVVGFYCLMRSFGLKEMSCCFGAISWAFCGYVTSVGNSWIWIIEFAAYLPLILYFSIKHIHKISIYSFSVLLILRVSVILLGQPQFYLYTMTFDFITVILMYYIVYNSKLAGYANVAALNSDSTNLSRVGFIKFAIVYMANNIFAVIIALPILLPGLHQASISTIRSKVLQYDIYSANSNNMLEWLNGLFYPFKSMGRTGWVNQDYISHVGYITILFFIVAIFTVRNNDKYKYVITFLVIMTFSLLWANNTFVTNLIYQLPYYNRFRWPFKLMFYTSFYMIIISTFGFDWIFNKAINKTFSKVYIASTLTACILLLHVATFLTIYGFLPQQSFGKHLDSVPLTEPNREEFATGRIVSIGFDIYSDGNNSVHGYTAPLLGYNYATLFGLYHFAGYEMLMTQRNAKATFDLNHSAVITMPPDESLDIGGNFSLDYFRKWGVKWYVIDKRIDLANIDKLKIIRSDAFTNILYDSEALPFVYTLDSHDKDRLSYNFSTNTIKISTQSNLANTVNINVLYNPFFSATVDGEAALITRTEDEQMQVKIPGGNHTIILKYSDPYFNKGIIISVTFTSLLIISAGLFIFRSRATSFNKHRKYLVSVRQVLV